MSMKHRHFSSLTELYDARLLLWTGRKTFSFYRIPKALFQEQRFQNLSTDAKTLYGILLDRMSLSVKNEWFDKQGRVFIIFTIEDVKRGFVLRRQQSDQATPGT